MTFTILDFHFPKVFFSLLFITTQQDRWKWGNGNTVWHFQGYDFQINSLEEMEVDRKIHSKGRSDRNCLESGSNEIPPSQLS